MFLFSDTSIPYLACLAFSDSIFFYFFFISMKNICKISVRSFGNAYELSH